MEFKIKNRYKKARTGVINTQHGEVQTPNLAIVATHGEVRLLNKQDHKKANLNLIISNTFHLWVNKKVPQIKKAGGIHKWNGLKIPTMTDSGGFQVFSLGWGKIHGIGKVVKEGERNVSVKDSDNPVEIDDDGVTFVYDKKKFNLTPEKSMKIQWDIGADIIFAFDECTSPFHNHAYNERSLKKTHAWAERSLKAHQKLRHLARRVPGGKPELQRRQALFGIVQGGVFEDLRKKSSKFIGSLDFDGFGIGGSFGENEMPKVIGWALSGLPDEKPRHLLGIGRIKDIFPAVEQGMDLFDCVVPTREARHGLLYTKEGKLNLRNSQFKNDKKLIDRKCGCDTCKGLKIRRNELRELFKSSEWENRHKAMRYATIHNIQFYKTLFEEIRKEISKGNSLSKLKKKYKNYL